MNFFSPDSLFSRIMSRIGDLIALNILFLLTCLPVFTIGAACSGLYQVVFSFDTDREQGIIKPYFRAFRENFKQSTQLWMMFLLFGIASGFNAVFFYSMSGAMHCLFIFFAAMLVVVIITAAYAFPLISRFENDWKTTLKNAFFLAVGYLPRSLAMAMLNVLPFGCLFLNLALFFQVGFLWLAIYFAAVAYTNTFLLKKVFAPYLT